MVVDDIKVGTKVVVGKVELTVDCSVVAVVVGLGVVDNSGAVVG